MKMRMVEPDYFDGIQTDSIGDEDFRDILNFLDFPMESLEGDGLDGEWNGSESKFGPIPDALMGLPPMPRGNIGKGGSKVLPKPVAPSKVNEAQGTAIFQTQSPVSVLESSSSCSGGKNISIKSDLVIPVRPRSKRVHSSAGNPWLLMDPMSSTTSASKKTFYAKKGKEKKRKLSHLSGGVKTLNMSVQHIKDTLPQISDVTEKKTSTQQSHFVKKCTHCEITKTPQWREGPLGPKTLCNACGVRFRSGRLFPEYRPSASPTFVPSLHSNSHRKVLEMRKMSSCGAAAVEESHNVMMMRRKREIFPESVIVEDSPTSPEPEFVPRSSYLSDMY